MVIPLTPFEEELTKAAYMEYTKTITMALPPFKDLTPEFKEAWKRAAIYCYECGQQDAIFC